MPTKTKTSKTKSKSSKDKSSKKKTKTSKKTKKTPVEEVVDVTQAVEAPAKKVTKRAKTKKTKSTAKKEVVPQTPVEEVIEATEKPELVTEEKPKKKRRQVDRESVIRDFDAIIATVESEIENIRSASDTKSRGGVKFLRSLNKSFKQLKKDTTRAMKQKRKNPNRPKNTTSGFMKPVAISKAMSSFTGWDADELKSRVDVTKYICNYIREKDLQNPADRRQIIPDKKLSNLLGVDKASLKEEPLTYYSLQRRIQPHFVK